MERINIRIAQIGGGPAAKELWLTAERMKKHPALGSAGVVVLDKGGSVESWMGPFNGLVRAQPNLLIDSLVEVHNRGGKTYFALDENQKIISQSDIVILTPEPEDKPIPLYREGLYEAGYLVEIGFLKKGDKILVNNQGNPFTSIKEYGNHTLLEQVFVTGNGSVEITPGIDPEDPQSAVFKDSIGRKRIWGVLKALEQIPSIATTNLAYENYEQFVKINPSSLLLQPSSYTGYL